MIKKDKILTHLHKPEDRSTVARIIDQIETVARGHELQVSDFYDPYNQNLIDTILSGDLNVKLAWSGGYNGAERQRMIMLPTSLADDASDAHISYIRIRANLKFQQLNHRDYLGAILSLGIKREKVGDLLPLSDGCQVIVDSDMVAYIKMNLQKIHRVSVSVETIQSAEIVLPVEKIKEIKTTVSSLRLDAVSGVGFGVARSEIANDIKGEKVKLNWGVCTDPAKKLKEKDIISIRGKGRLSLDQINGATRKGKIAILIKRFI